MNGVSLGILAGLATLVAITILAGQPPHHCRYMVPVTNHPGVYSCSEYPRPLKASR